MLLTGLVPYFFWWLLIHSYSFMLLLTPDTCQGERERRRERKKGRKVEKEKIRRGGKEQEERERKRMGRGNIQVNIYSLFLQG